MTEIKRDYYNLDLFFFIIVENKEKELKQVYLQKKN